VFKSGSLVHTRLAGDRIGRLFPSLQCLDGPPKRGKDSFRRMDHESASIGEETLRDEVFHTWEERHVDLLFVWEEGGREGEGGNEW
jgi:hypothetical protein